jgi:hypothetical protein
MDKKLLNEDVKNMKYLFGYKPGRVISEQDIDYTTDDYLDVEMDEGRRPDRIVKHIDTNKIVGSHKHGVGFTPNSRGEELGFEHHPVRIPHGTKFGGTEVGDFDYEDEDFLSLLDDDTLFEQEEPETDRYMFFSNLQQIHRQTGILLEKDPNMISNILENGHDWAQDHIATSKESIDQVFDFLMNEEKGDGDDDFEMVMNEQEEPETVSSILRRHRLRYEVQNYGDTRIIIMNKSSEVVQKLLSILHLFNDLKLLTILNCEFADFSDVDICGLSELVFININGTENNFKEQDYECARYGDDGFIYLE